MAKKSEVSTVIRNEISGLLVAEGVVAILFGIAALFWPGLTVVLLTSLFGIFIIVVGVIELVRSLLNIGRENLWWLQLIFAVLIIGLGVFLLRNLTLTIATLILFIGFTLIIRGLIDLVTAFFSKDSEVKDNRWFYVAGGALALVTGIVVLSHPVATGLAFVWALGLFSILQGALFVALAFRVRPDAA